MLTKDSATVSLSMGSIFWFVMALLVGTSLYSLVIVHNIQTQTEILVAQVDTLTSEVLWTRKVATATASGTARLLEAEGNRLMRESGIEPMSPDPNAMEYPFKAPDDSQSGKIRRFLDENIS